MSCTPISRGLNDFAQPEIAGAGSIAVIAVYEDSVVLIRKLRGWKQRSNPLLLISGSGESAATATTAITADLFLWLLDAR